MIQEFQSPSFRNENMLQFEALLLVGLIVVGLVVPPRRGSWKALWIVFFAHMALGSVRHVPVFVTVDGADDCGGGRGVVEELDRRRQESLRCSGFVNQMAADSIVRFRRIERLAGDGGRGLDVDRAADSVAEGFSRRDFSGEDGSRRTRRKF